MGLKTYDIGQQPYVRLLGQFKYSHPWDEGYNFSLQSLDGAIARMKRTNKKIKQQLDEIRLNHFGTRDGATDPTIWGKAAFEAADRVGGYYTSRYREITTVWTANSKAALSQLIPDFAANKYLARMSDLETYEWQIASDYDSATIWASGASTFLHGFAGATFEFVASSASMYEFIQSVPGGRSSYWRLGNYTTQFEALGNPFANDSVPATVPWSMHVAVPVPTSVNPANGVPYNPVDPLTYTQVSVGPAPSNFNTRTTPTADDVLSIQNRAESIQAYYQDIDFEHLQTTSVPTTVRNAVFTRGYDSTSALNHNLNDFYTYIEDQDNGGGLGAITFLTPTSVIVYYQTFNPGALIMQGTGWFTILIGRATS